MEGNWPACLSHSRVSQCPVWYSYKPRCTGQTQISVYCVLGYSMPGFVRFDIKLVEWLRKFEMCVFVIEIFVVVPYYCEYYYCVFTTL